MMSDVAMRFLNKQFAKSVLLSSTGFLLRCSPFKFISGVMFLNFANGDIFSRNFECLLPSAAELSKSEYVS